MTRVKAKKLLYKIFVWCNRKLGDEDDHVTISCMYNDWRRMNSLNKDILAYLRDNSEQMYSEYMLYTNLSQRYYKMYYTIAACYGMIDDTNWKDY